MIRRFLRRRALPLMLLAGAGLLSGCYYYDPYTGAYVPYGTGYYGTGYYGTGYYGYPSYPSYPSYGYAAPAVSGSVVVGGGGCWNCGWRGGWWGRRGYWGWRRW